MIAKLGRPKSESSRKTFTTTLKDEVISLLKKEAFKNQGPVNVLIEHAVRQVYERPEEKDQC